MGVGIGLNPCEIGQVVLTGSNGAEIADRLKFHNALGGNGHKSLSFLVTNVRLPG